MNSKFMLCLSTAMMASVVMAATTDAPKKEDECIFSNNIRDWTVLDSRHMLVWASSKDAYLMTLIAPLEDTSMALSLAFVDKDSNGMICGHGSDAVSVPESAIHSIPSIISGMHRVDDAELQQLTEKYKVNLVPKKKKDKSTSESTSSSSTSAPDK